MDSVYSELIDAIKHWAAMADGDQQITAQHKQLIDGIDQRSPDSLFSDAEHRPLIVAFMGGTGVGKSSLINRLAEQTIARTGVERPTSREVTLYHHTSVEIARLPEELPLDKIRVSRHHQVHNQNLVWVDMPDFDSIDAQNRSLVLEWLPHIDVLLYVVSPDRYRDNKAWQLLLAEGAKHAWVFVMNHWDRGLPEQKNDFIRQLAKAGFENPLVFCTDCATQQGDDFTALMEQLQQLSTQQSAQQIEQRGRQVRLKHIKQVLQTVQSDFADRNYAAVQQGFEQHWQNTEEMMQEGLAWSIQQFATQQVDKGVGGHHEKLWDDWAQSRLMDLIDSIVLQADQHQLPVHTLRSRLHELAGKAADTVNSQAELECRKALLNPGNKLQRIVLKTLKVLEFMLPLAAMSFVSYELVTEFYENAQQRDAYLGVDFAIHSVLLIAVTWLFPYFLHKKLQPSQQKAAFHGTQKGVLSGLLQLKQALDSQLDQARTQHLHSQQQLQQLCHQAEQLASSTHAAPLGAELDRMMLDQ